MKFYLFVVFLISGSLARFVDETEQPDTNSIEEEILNDDPVNIDLDHGHNGHSHCHCHHHHDDDDDDHDHHHNHKHDESPHVAFSVHLNKTIPKSGEGQHLKFDAVLLNDGDGYDPLTGIFRAPECGVYSFTYVVAAKYPRFIDAHLMIQGKQVNGAAAYSKYRWHGKLAQGSNTAIVHMHHDEQAWIAVNEGTSVVDKTVFQYNTFSGFLLYTRE